MLHRDDLKWIAGTSTELNTILQQIARYADLARQHKGEQSYIDLLSDRVQLASKTAQELFDRVTLRILEETTAQADPVKQAVPDAVSAEPKQPVVTAQAEPDEGSAIPADIKVLNETGNRELLLLIEDEREVADLAAVMLTDEGYKVIIAYDGFEALKIYKQIHKKIGLVILDYFLPVISGDAVFDELCVLNPNAAVVLSSGFGEQSKLGSMLARGLKGFIPKPYTREKLLVQVRSILDAARDSGR